MDRQAWEDPTLLKEKTVDDVIVAMNNGVYLMWRCQHENCTRLVTGGYCDERWPLAPDNREAVMLPWFKLTLRQRMRRWIRGMSYM